MRCFAFRRAVAVAIACASVAVSGDGRADDKAECSAAYEQTQSLKTSGKLEAARQQVSQCVRTACAPFIRSDCARWLTEIEAAQPTILFEVKDANGSDTAAVRVTLDGKPWLTSLDGRAKPLDPGRHLLRFEIAGAPPRDQEVVVTESEKNRRVQISFRVLPEPGVPPRQSLAPWVLGGVGVALAGAGIVLGVVVLGAKSDVDNLCPGAVCPSQAAKNQADGPRSTVNTLGPISTVGMVAGGAAIGAAAVWLAVRKPARPSSIGFAPAIAPGTAGASLRGAF